MADIIQIADVRRVLQVRDIFNDWDPLHLFPYANRGAYQREVEFVLNRISGVESVQQVTSIIEEAFRVYLDEYSVDSDCEKVAAQVWRVLSARVVDAGH